MSEGLTKHKIAENVSANTGFSHKESLTCVELLLEIMKITLESGEKIKVAGFGNFEVKQKADRRGRNPQTGETLTITSRKILSFKPSQILKANINKG